MGKMGCWGLKKEEQNYISDVWEKWGGHIWGNGVLGILLKERIQFLTYGRNAVATYGEKGCATYGRNGCLGGEIKCPSDSAPKKESNSEIWGKGV